MENMEQSKKSYEKFPASINNEKPKKNEIEVEQEEKNKAI